MEIIIVPIYRALERIKLVSMCTVIATDTVLRGMLFPAVKPAMVRNSPFPWRASHWYTTQDHDIQADSTSVNLQINLENVSCLSYS